MIKRTVGCVALWAWLMATGLLQAHHSLAGVYDMKGEKELSGTVEKMQFTNPYGSMVIAVKNAVGTTISWVLTIGSATALAQKGIGKTGPYAVHVGSNISVKVIPAKDGSPLGVLKAVTFADGHVIEVFGGSPND